MHWLYFDRIAGAARAAGFTYDSTWGYNEAVGYRAGTSQVFVLDEPTAGTATLDHGFRAVLGPADGVAATRSALCDPILRTRGSSAEPSSSTGTSEAWRPSGSGAASTRLLDAVAPATGLVHHRRSGGRVVPLAPLD